METDYLRDFMVFSESMSYARASEALFMSHPTLRSHISALEKSIGASLTEKTGGQTVLTPAGRRLVAEGNKILSLVDSISRDCQRLSNETVIMNVGLNTYSAFKSIIEKARARYQEDNPGCSADVKPVAHSCNRKLALADGIVDFDIGFVLNLKEAETRVASLETQQDETIFLQTVKPVLFWCGPKSPLFNKEIITAADMADMELLLVKSDGITAFGEQLKQTLGKRGISLRIRNFVCDSFYEYFQCDIGEMVASGYKGVEDQIRMLNPASDIKLWCLEDPDLHMEIHTAYREDVINPKKLGFINALRAVACEI